MAKSKNFFESLTSNGKSYVDGRVTEVKLKAVKALSKTLSFICGMLLFFVVLAILFGVLALALIQWMNALLGAPYGTLAVAGLFALAALFIFIFRKKMFRSSFVAMFSKLFFDEDSDIDSFSDLKKAEKENAEALHRCSEDTKDTLRDLKVKLSPLNLLSELLSKSNDVIDNAGTVFKSLKALLRTITGRGYRYEEPDEYPEDNNQEIDNPYEENADDCHPADGDSEPQGTETPRV